MRINRSRLMRRKADLMEIRRSILELEDYYKRPRSKTLKGMLFAIITVLGFFSMGYLVAALYIPIWAKVMLFAFVALFGVIPGYLLANLFR